jgi:hypothetical protein
MIRVNDNILDINDYDYYILCNSDLNYINSYRDILYKYLLKCRDIMNKENNKLIRVKIAMEILILLDTKSGHHLLKNDNNLYRSVNNKIKVINETINYFSETDLYDIQYFLNKLTPIFTNIKTINIDYTTYNYAYEYTIKV